MSFAINEVFDDRYEIVAAPRTGGSGQVYKCRELLLDRIIALKVLDSALLSNQDSDKRFRREGRILSSLEHKNLVVIYHYGISRQGRHPYLAMEYIDGQDLRAMLEQSGPVSVERVFKIARQVCNGLARAHEEGIVHRDIKPANIMLRDTEFGADQVTIIDFGLARNLDHGGTTITGQIHGTALYMSPEQCSGKQVDHRTDIYSLGCLMYELLTGRPPFQADDAYSLLAMHANKTPLTLHEVSHVPMPTGLDEVLRKALSKDPDDRYQSICDLADDLERVQSGRGEELNLAGNTNSLQRASNTAKVKQRLAMAGALMLLLGTVSWTLRGGEHAEIAELRLQGNRLHVMRRLAPIPVDSTTPKQRLEYYREWLAKFGGSELKSAALANELIADDLMLDHSTVASAQKHFTTAIELYLKVCEQATEPNENFTLASAHLFSLLQARSQLKRMEQVQLKLVQPKFRTDEQFIATNMARLGLVCAEKGNFSEALEWCSKALKEPSNLPQRTEVLLAAAEVRLLAKLNGAKKLLDDIPLSMSPNNAIVSAHKMEQAVQRWNLLPGAETVELRLCEIGTALTPSSPTQQTFFKVNQGLALTRLGRYDESNKCLRELLRSPKPAPETQLILLSLERNAHHQRSPDEEKRIVNQVLENVRKVNQPALRLHLILMAFCNSDSMKKDADSVKQVAAILTNVPLSYRLNASPNIAFLCSVSKTAAFEPALVEVFVAQRNGLLQQGAIGNAQVLSALIASMCASARPDLAKEMLKDLKTGFSNQTSLPDRRGAYCAAVDAAQTLRDYACAIQICTLAIDEMHSRPHSDNVNLCLMLIHRAEAFMALDQWASARNSAEESVSLTQGIGDFSFWLRARFQLAYICLHLHDYAAGNRVMDELRTKEDKIITEKGEFLALQNSYARHDSKAHREQVTKHH